MKKIILTLALVLGACTVALAIPAKPGKYVYTQPDGTNVVLETHGDEYFHWTTDASGQVVEKNALGFYVKMNMTTFAARRRQGIARREAARRGAWSSYETAPVTNFGNRKILCILANFSDSTYVINNPKEMFSNMLNQSGYSNNGAVGSVRDYYVDNSLGQYLPQFDVYGPVQLTQSSAYYDKNGADLAIMEAYALMADQIPINDYDTDGDGNVDMVLFYYPGHNEAEHAGEESIWPHQSTGNFGSMGGKNFVRYFCTSELSGSKGANMCGIGPTCHEFAHSLGLPDFYDTDYEDNGSNDFTTAYFDIMCSGCYNDNSRRPPYMSAVERNMLGWMENPPVIGAGDYTLGPVRRNNAYICKTLVDGEYFVLECRDNDKWDAILGETGMLVYHVDKSSRVVTGSYTAGMLWEYSNMINAFGGHPCYYILPARSNMYYMFPGKFNTSSLTFKDWDGNPTGIVLSGISYSDGKVTFTSTLTTSRMMTGTVYDSVGKPIAGAQVVLSQSVRPFLLNGDRYVTTDASGNFSFSLPDEASNEQILTVHKEGYVSMSMNIPVEGQIVNQDFYLWKQGEGEHLDLHRYNPSLNLYVANMGVASYATGMHYSAADIEALNLGGGKLEAISFATQASTYDKVYVMAVIDGKMALLKDATSQFASGNMVVVDVSDENVVIPAGSDLYIAYGLTGLDTSSGSLLVYGMDSAWNESCYVNADFLNNPSAWQKVNFGTGVYLSAIIGAEVSRAHEMNFSDLGVAYVKVNADGTLEVVPPAGKTVYSTQWFLGGRPVSDTSASGSYMVRLEYYDGTAERVYYQK